MKYVHGNVFLTFLITKTSLEKFRVYVFLYVLIAKTSFDKFEVYRLGKIILYFEILTWSPTLTLGFLSLSSLPKSMYILS